MTQKNDIVTIQGEGEKAWRVVSIEKSHGNPHAHLVDPDNKHVKTAAEVSRLVKADLPDPKPSPAAVVAKASDNNVQL